MNRNVLIFWVAMYLISDACFGVSPLPAIEPVNMELLKLTSYKCYASKLSLYHWKTLFCLQFWPTFQLVT